MFFVLSLLFSGTKAFQNQAYLNLAAARSTRAMRATAHPKGFWRSVFRGLPRCPEKCHELSKRCCWNTAEVMIKTSVRWSCGLDVFLYSVVKSPQQTQMFHWNMSNLKCAFLYACLTLICVRGQIASMPQRYHWMFGRRFPKCRSRASRMLRETVDGDSQICQNGMCVDLILTIWNYQGDSEN